MQVHQYLGIGFRLLSIVIFIYSLRQTATFFTVAFTDAYAGMPASPAFFFAMAAIPLIIALILWIFPSTIAKKVVPPESHVSVAPGKTFSILVALVLTVGLYTFFYAVVDSIYWLTYTHLWPSSPEPYDRVSEVVQSNRANMIATVFEFVASLALILRAKYIANFLYKVAQ